MENNISSEIKVNILSEALPYIKKFYGSIIVIKYGGNAMIDPNLKAGFAKDVVLLKLVGMHPIVVHGGGPQINDVLNKFGKKNDFIKGFRVTDKETMSIVKMVLAGSINNEIVSLINYHGGKAVGINGHDASFIQAKKLTIKNDNKDSIDIGNVGKIIKIDATIVNQIIHSGYIPVIAPLGIGKNGESYNINADLVAGKLSQAIKAQKLILMTNISGVLDKNGNLLTNLTPSLVKKLTKEGYLYGGMLPKIESAMESAKNGVNAVHIIDGRIVHALLLEIFTNKGIGSMVFNN